MTTRLPPTPCPICGYRLDAASSLEDASAVPEPGDVTVCFECTTVLMFTAFGVLRLPTVEEAQRVYADPEVERTRAGIAAFRRGEQLEKIKGFMDHWSLAEQELPAVFTITDRGTGRQLWQEAVTDYGAIKIPLGWPRPVSITVRFATGRTKELL